jgi:hypothetical protein
MYWFRTDTSTAILPWLAVVLIFWLGGWLLTTRAFKLEPRERLLAGFALGLVLYGFFVNLIGRWLQPDITFIGASILTLGVGLILNGKSDTPWSDWSTRENWIPVAWAFALGAAMLKINQGIAIFDEFTHLPIVSTIAAGDIPPHYPLNARVLYAYHHGFHILAGAAMRLGNLFAWSASDLIKSMAWGTAVGLAGLWGKRYLPHESGGWLAALVLVFMSSTRYLLLLMPKGLLIRLDNSIVLQGDEAAMGLPFSQMLSAFWQIEGDAPYPFSFGFQSGIAEPYIVNHTGSNTLYVMIFLLFLLLVKRSTGWRSLVALAPLFAFWALTAETSYGMFAVGAALVSAALLWYRIKDGTPLKENLRQLTPEMSGLLLSAPLALLQGGLLTEVMKGVLGLGDAGAAGFTLRWPPAILSKHLGALSIFSPGQLLVGLFELGPLIVFTPWLTAWAYRKLRAGEWLWPALVLTGWICLLFPMLLEYHSGPDISRITAFGLMVWALALLAWGFEFAGKGAYWLKPALATGFSLACLGGLMMGVSLLSAAPKVTFSGELTDLDAAASARYFDQLEPASELFDVNSSRGPALFGRLNHSRTGNQAVGFGNDDSRTFLIENPSPENMLDNGYRYLYVDESWWERMSLEEQTALSLPCVQILFAQIDKDENRMLLDLERCR